MKKLLLSLGLLLLAATLLLAASTRRLYRQNQRLKANQHALAEHLIAARSDCDSIRSSCEVLQLTLHEFRALQAADAATIRALGIRLRRLESSAVTHTESRIEAAAPLRDTLRIVRHDTLPLIDSLRTFRWQDGWNIVEGVVGRDSIHCTLTARDTLRQIIHRVPRRFLFIRWGTKAIRQEIHSSNPAVRIIYSDYVEIRR